MKLPTTCDGWATRVSAYVKAGRELLGLPRFPIKIAEVAQDYSRNVFPDAAITTVSGDDLKKFEGALVPHPSGNGEWGIFYNSGLSSRGRINFSLAHEFGHYLVHRHLSGEPFYCSRRNMWDWDSAYGKMEAEANRFASLVLMPPDDFRIQTAGFTRPTLAAFEIIKDRYEVSLTAAVLKWLEMGAKRAMLVVSVDGFIDWSWSSPALLKSGVFFKPKQITTPVPDHSLAALGPNSGISEVMHPAGVWNAREPVYESVVFAEYHDMVLSLLIYPSDAPNRWAPEYEDAPEPMDSFDAFQR